MTGVACGDQPASERFSTPDFVTFRQLVGGHARLVHDAVTFRQIRQDYMEG